MPKHVPQLVGVAVVALAVAVGDVDLQQVVGVQGLGDADDDLARVLGLVLDEFVDRVDLVACDAEAEVERGVVVRACEAGVQ